MKIKIIGTFTELRQLYLYDLELLSRLLCIDYYKLHLVGSNETFIITESDYERVGLLPRGEEDVEC